LLSGCNWVIGIPEHELAGAITPPFGDLETVLEGDWAPRDLGVDQTHLFWLNEGANELTVQRAAKDAPATVELVAEGEVYHFTNGWGLELDGLHVFSLVGTSSGHSHVHRASKDGSGGTAFYDTGAGWVYRAFDIAGNSLVWVQRGPMESPNYPMTVFQGSTDGAQSAITLTEDAHGVRDVELAGGRTYYSNSGTDQILRVQTGDAPQVVLDSMPTVSEIEVAGGFLFAISDSGELRRWPVDGSSGAEAVSNVEDSPRGLSSDGVFVYWGNLGSGEVRAMALEGDAPQTIATGLSEPYDTAADENHVYVADRGAGRIVRIAKP
jgi:hypothetical protein